MINKEDYYKLNISKTEYSKCYDKNKKRMHNHIDHRKLQNEEFYCYIFYMFLLLIFIIS